MRRTGNLPIERAPFFGRDDELISIGRSFADGRRLVTLTGTAGIGKTRLARHVARLYAESATPEAGVWLCDLTEATASVDDVERIIAGVLGIPLSVEGARDQLAEALATRGDVLLVLDNADGIVSTAAEAVSRWLEVCPDIRFLVTSREVLAIDGEVRIELGPLDAGAAYEVLRVHAAEVLGAFEPSVEQSEKAREIVRLAEGNPLALKLAAGRLTVLGLSKLRDQLSRSFAILTTDLRDVPPRHASLERAIRASWELLSPLEQRALRQCSVFEGGFALEDAEAVLWFGSETPPVIDLLHALRKKSLITSGAATTELRLAMYDAIRRFGEAELDASAERGETERRHVLHFASRGEARARDTEGPGVARALAALEADQANLFAALRRAASTTSPQPTSAVRIGLALGALFAARGPGRTCLAVLDAAVESSSGLDDTLRAEALIARATARGRLGLRELAARDAHEALAVALRAGVAGYVAAARDLLGVDAMWRRQWDEAEAQLQLAADIATESDDPLRAGAALKNLGVLRYEQARTSDACELTHRALIQFRECGARVREGIALVNLGCFQVDFGQLDRARIHLQQALSIAREVGNLRAEVSVLGNLAGLELEEGELSEAIERYREALQLQRLVGGWRAELTNLVELGIAQTLSGDLADADELLERATVLAQRADHLGYGAIAFAHWALVLTARGHGARATDAFRAAHERASRANSEPARAVVDALVPSEVAVALQHVTKPIAELEELAERSQSVRLALRCRLAIAAPTVSESSARRSQGSVSDALLIGNHGLWFIAPGAERVDLARRRALPRLLFALARARLERPGEPLGVTTLIEAGWPGEQMSLSAGTSRVYVAIGTLRRLGLGPSLATRGDGYLLDPGSALSLEDETAVASI